MARTARTGSFSNSSSQNGGGADNSFDYYEGTNSSGDAIYNNGVLPNNNRDGSNRNRPAVDSITTTAAAASNTTTTHHENLSHPFPGRANDDADHRMANTNRVARRMPAAEYSTERHHHHYTPNSSHSIQPNRNNYHSTNRYQREYQHGFLNDKCCGRGGDHRRRRRGEYRPYNRPNHSRSYRGRGSSRPQYFHNRRQEHWHRNNHDNTRNNSNNRDTPRHQQNEPQNHREREEMLTLKSDVARLQKELNEMKEKQGCVGPHSLSANEREQFTELDVSQNLSTEPQPSAAASIAHHFCQTSVTMQNVPVVSTARETNENENDDKTSGSTNNAVVESLSNADQQGQAPNDDTFHTNVASNDGYDSCFDASTDEEGIFDPPSMAYAAATSNDDGKEEEKEGVGGNDVTWAANAGIEENGDNANEHKSNDEDSVDLVVREDYDKDGHIAFCCQNCTCYKIPSRMKNFHIRIHCGNSGDNIAGGNFKLFHKGCCHGDQQQTNDYLSPMTIAINKTVEGKMKDKKKQQVKSRSESKSQKFEKAYRTAMREEAKYENEEYDVDKVCQNLTNPAYQNYCAMFQQRKKDRRSPIRVLDCFSGIGCGIVALKRLGIPIHTVVHIEHDPVAVEVCKFNHKNDGIIHHYMETFEEIYGVNDEPDVNLITDLVAKHGPFDLVLSGAPCQNHSHLNASRDQTSENAQYLKKVGCLIQKLDHIQGLNGIKDPVLFLSENVVFKEHEDIDKAYSDLSPIRLDAKDFSPAKRNRFYWINLPINSSDQIKLVASGVSVDGLLDEGYGAIARLLPGGGKNVTVKSNAFLASLSRIDDGRMSKYKIENNLSSSSNAVARYTIESYSIGEREKIMGLPTGYVEKPLKILFNELAINAFLNPEFSNEGKSYRDFLPRRFWHYRKKCQFKFQPKPDHPFFQLALSSPLGGKCRLAFYDEEQYGKHLVGNGWSIPVAEFLLGKLVDLFADDALKTYDDYSYQFPWEPYMSM